jgi:hypothetical protein
MTVKATDAAANQSISSTSLTITVDTISPTVTMNALPATIGSGTILSAAPADGGSGVSSVAYFSCLGSSCTPATPIGTSSPGDDWPLSWTSQPADGTYQLLARALDVAGNSADSAKLTAAINNTTVLIATSHTISNGTSGTAGKAEQGDTITITFNRALTLSSVCSTWTSASQTVTNITVDMDKGNQNNKLTFSSGQVGASSCTTGVNIGSLTTASGLYNPTSSNKQFTGSTLTWDASRNALVMTLGSCGSGCPTGVVSSQVQYAYAPHASIATSGPTTITTSVQPTRTRINF